MACRRSVEEANEFFRSKGIADWSDLAGENAASLARRLQYYKDETFLTLYAVARFDLFGAGTEGERAASWPLFLPGRRFLVHPANSFGSSLKLGTLSPPSAAPRPSPPGCRRT